MHKAINQIELTATPAALDPSFDLLSATLEEAGYPGAPFALFGGAVRDTDCAAHYGEPSLVNDYDLRVWLPEDGHDEHVRQFVTTLGAVSMSEIRETPSAGTGRIRYCLDYRGAELDISIRPPANTSLVVARVAIERAGDSDAGLSSVAIAQDKTAWATPEYESDRNNRTITIYPRLNSERRLREYTEKMQGKFPGHRVIRISEV